MNVRAIGAATAALSPNGIAAPALQIRAGASKDRPLKAEKDSLTTGDLRVVCLWSIAGLVLTGLLASLGFGDQIAQFLAAAG